jgi:hypothetical protein
MAAFDFANMFAGFKESNEKSWKYDRNASVGASEAFDCIRKAYFKKYQYEPDDGHNPDWGAATRGDIIENHFAVPAVKSILPKGCEFLFAGDEQETLKKGRLSATPDGLVIDAPRDALAQLGVEDIESDCFVVEFKSFDPRANIKEAKPVHAGQTQVQMGLLHELTEYRPEYAIIIYMNASWLTDIRIFVIKRNPKIYQVAIDRSKQVFRTENPKDLMAEGKLSGACDFCEFQTECAIASEEAMPTKKQKVNDETLERLAVLAARQKELAAVAKDADEDKKAVEVEIKELLRKADSRGASDDRFSISLAWIGGKKSLDQTLLAADLAEAGKSIEDYQKEGNGYERLTVKLKD